MVVERIGQDNVNDVIQASSTLGYWESWRIWGRSGDDLLTGGESHDSLFGEIGNDTLSGRAGNDLLDGGSGNDKMYGGTGNDTYMVDSSGDLVSELYNQGTDLVKSYISYTLGADVENLELLGTAITGTGNSLNNSIKGNWYNNTLSGADGNDTLEGFSGNDTLYGGYGNDTLDGGIGNDYLRGDFGADVLRGGDNNDTLMGSSDSLQDTLAGGRHDDKYFVVNANNIIQENVGEGYDTVQSYISSFTITDAQSIERIELMGAASSATGNSFSNVIVGNASANTLSGGDGIDTLTGGGGNDVLYGGKDDDYLYGGDGNDTLSGCLPGRKEIDSLYGGANADTFSLSYFTSSGSQVGYVGEGHAVIKDFSRLDGDKIRVAGGIATYQLDQTANVIGGTGIDTRIFRNGDLIAIVQDNTQITLGTDVVNVAF